MKAIRVRTRSRSGQRRGPLRVVHWLAGDWTECGRQRAHLDVVDELELEELAYPEACEVCEELRSRGQRAIPARELPLLSTRPGRGRLRKAGPLYHGLMPRDGEWLRGQDE
jgi:hypothetical protein